MVRPQEERNRKISEKIKTITAQLFREADRVWVMGVSTSTRNQREQVLTWKRRTECWATAACKAKVQSIQMKCNHSLMCGDRRCAAAREMYFFKLRESKLIKNISVFRTKRQLRKQNSPWPEQNGKLAGFSRPFDHLGSSLIPNGEESAKEQKNERNRRDTTSKSKSNL